MEKRLPNNWVETELENLSQIQSGGTPSRGVASYWDGDIPWVKISDIKDIYVTETEECITKEGLNNSSAKVFKKGTILFTIFATIGKVGILDIDATTNQAIVGLTPNKTIDRLYLMYVLENLSSYISTQGKGIAQKNINISILKGTLIPLPPLAEQKRIADKLDILFGRLETIRKATDHIPELIKKFRQQILTYAVTGKLTEKWRQENVFDVCDIVEVIDSEYDSEDIPDTWIYSTIENVGKVKGGKRLPAGEELVEQNTGFPYIRARDLKGGTVLTKNMMYLLPETQQKIKSYIVKTDDVYITIVGAKIGDAGIIPESMNNANLTENAAKITLLHQDLYAHYLSLWLRASICQKNIQESIKSAAQGKLALARINKLPIYLPPKKEQEEIVSRVQSLFEKLEIIEQKFQMLKTKLDNLPQALLHKAFKGELVEQLPTDGNAADLLREIEQLQKSIKKK